MKHALPPRLRRTVTRSTAAGATVAALALGAFVAPTTASADSTLPAPDGLTAATAAASCWEVKVNTPSAPSGVYWLYTPALGAPQQFYCDQDTDGGGWVLIGRGRENFSQSGEGYGPAADVRNTPTGPGAFDARELPAATVDDLLNGTSVSALPDGVRLRRATNTAGTSWQETRFTYSSPRDDWSWQFDDLQRIGTFSFDGATGSGGTTESFGLDSAFKRVQTTTINNLRIVNGKTTGRNDGWSTGFGYGTGVTGSSAASSYLYQGSTGYVRPFTQVYLRPKLLSSAVLSDIPAKGTPAVTRPAVAQSLALKTVWGVNGLGAAGKGIENTEVSAFTQSGDRVFVGGNFDHVQQDSKGTGLTKQSYLAAFDVKTGQFIPTFKPVFNDQVKALATLPDGRIVAGGEFTTVNGVAENGLVVLDPTTGAIDPTFTGRLINALSSSGGQAKVRALDVQGGWLYVGGSFTHATGGSIASQVYSRGAVRLSVTDGTPDKNLTFEFDGTVISLDASSQGDRVYFAGYFADDKTSSAYRVAAVTTADGSVIPWTVKFTSPDSAATIAAGKTATYQQAVREVGNRVWIGGSEHMIFSYNRSDLSEASTNVMSAEGGDGQVLATDGTSIYGGCHCYLGVYENAQVTPPNWRDPGTAWTRASKIEAVGAWNAATGVYEPAFSPSFTEREGAGGWAVFTDSTGVTWMGGDFTAVRTGSTGKSWAGGYARFPAADSTAPSAPTGLAVSTTADGVAAAWTASKDDSGSVTYQVLRKDRVIATTSSTSITLAAAPADTNYFVRAVDDAGNISASTAAVTATAPSAPSGGAGELVAAGSSWHWLHPTTAPDASWNTTGFDDSSWSTGAAPLGWGDASVATTLPGSAPRPLTAYYRASVTVKDPASLGTVTLTTRADDGVVLYVNGTEVGRANMPSGPVTNGTYATSAVSTANALAKPVTFTVSADRFTAGTNVIAAEVHSNYKATSSSSFDLTATADGKPVVPVQGVALPSGSVLVDTASTWSYSQPAAAQAADWASPAFDSSSWATGKAVLGWGTGDIATQLPAAAGSRPLASYYRKSFDIPKGSIPSGGLTLTTRADDGVIVFVNGTEVGRSNLPSGTITGSSYALSAPNTPTAEAHPVTFTVPASVLVDGTNVIAAQVQSNYRSTQSTSFDLKAVVQ